MCWTIIVDRCRGGHKTSSLCARVMTTSESRQRVQVKITERNSSPLLLSLSLHSGPCVRAKKTTFIANVNNLALLLLYHLRPEARNGIFLYARAGNNMQIRRKNNNQILIKKRARAILHRASDGGGVPLCNERKKLVIITRSAREES